MFGRHVSVDPTFPTPDDVPVSQEPAQFSRRDLQDRAVRGAAWTLIHTLVSLPLAFIVNIVIARILGVVDYGRLAYLTAVLGFASNVISLGVGTGVVQFGAKAHAAGRIDEVRHLLGASLGFRLLVTVPILTFVIIRIADVEPWLVAVAVAFGVFIPALFGGAPACFGIENKTAQGAQNAMVVNLLTQTVVVATILAIPSADAVWAARLGMSGVAVVMALPYVSRFYRRALMTPRLPVGFPDGFWKFALPAGLAALVGGFLADRGEVMVLTWMSATHAAGIFALAFGLINHLFGPAQALLGPLVPAVAGLREIDEDAVGQALGRTLRASSTIVALLVGAAIPAFAYLAVPIYGSDYQDVPAVMIALGIGGGLAVVAGPVQAFVQARLSGVRLLWVNLVAVVVDVLLLVVLVPPLGVWGATIANVGAIATRFVILLAGEVRQLQVSWLETVHQLTPLLAGGLASLVAWITPSWLGVSGVSGALVAGVVGLIFVVLGVQLSRSGLTYGDAAAVSRILPTRVRALTSPFVRLLTGRGAERE